MSDIEPIVDGMKAAGWPGFELRRYGGPYQATFFSVTPFSMVTIKAVGRGETIIEAVLKAKEEADARKTPGSQD